jgi:hypothetical protein
MQSGHKRWCVLRALFVKTSVFSKHKAVLGALYIYMLSLRIEIRTAALFILCVSLAATMEIRLCAQKSSKNCLGRFHAVGRKKLKRSLRPPPSKSEQRRGDWKESPGKWRNAVKMGKCIRKHAAGAVGKSARSRFPLLIEVKATKFTLFSNFCGVLFLTIAYCLADPFIFWAQVLT